MRANSEYNINAIKFILNPKTNSSYYYIRSENSLTFQFGALLSLLFMTRSEIEPSDIFIEAPVFNNRIQIFDMQSLSFSLLHSLSF